MTTIIQRINQLLDPCNQYRHAETIDALINEHLPHGSGIDNGVTLDYEISKQNKKIVFDFEYHFMNEYGLYDGWGSYTLRVYPAFCDIRLTISGSNKNDIKEYLYDTFYDALTQELPHNHP